MTRHSISWPGLNLQILIAAVAGLILGYWLNGMDDASALRSNILYAANVMGRLFIDLLKMILIPLIFTSIVVGVANLQAHRHGGQVWRYTLGFFALSMVCAMVLALVVTDWVQPGSHLQLAMFADSMENFEAKQLSAGEFFAQFLHSLFMNPMAALADGKILPVVVFALLLGIALVKSGEQKMHILVVLQELLALLMRMIQWIMLLAPFGVFALLTKLLATQDLSLLASMGEFIVLVFAITLIHGAVILPGLLWLFTRQSPQWLWRGARPALITAFATSSSAATLPISLRCSEENLGVSKDVAGFVLPVGATMNMDGTALYEAAAALFIAYLIGIDLSVGQQIIVMLTAMIASMGAPGIPSAGMVTMVMVLQSVGLPAEAIAILLPIDRILDTVRTAVNVEGDIVASIVVDQALKNRSDNSG
ncbi:dicarboxylate/amino acid:cation symporter [Oceanobacter sp. 4_MG-2023]|uniref:dicarboxylate/amino acid:cation symporter n=2 Tax=Gammaproteobacteria TaxID=1236 RepID=UPI00273435CA|nr:dicarboxylate/amino acid:cation symporter [Oceanobacter sp. 4_MG-2023]MDP2547357.1 dicarboxylate/amino acid:cation symporter [Oceanobacter sp. 4_MG-2023]